MGWMHLRPRSRLTAALCMQKRSAALACLLVGYLPSRAAAWGAGSAALTLSLSTSVVPLRVCVCERESESESEGESEREREREPQKHDI